MKVTAASTTGLNHHTNLRSGSVSAQQRSIIQPQPLAWLLLALLASGCTSTPATPSAGEASDTDRTETPTAAQQPGQPAPPPAARQPDAGDATLALLQLSERAQSAGSLSEAIAYAERAIRIKPRQADLWLRLAALELANEQPKSVIQYANKSLSLADGQPKLQQQAWLLIADARTALGDHEAAEAIRQRWGTYRG